MLQTTPSFRRSWPLFDVHLRALKHVPYCFPAVAAMPGGRGQRLGRTARRGRSDRPPLQRGPVPAPQGGLNPCSK